ncbi:hypothetical protein [Mesorhizobium sp.]|uniref:hypothetical protein n=1 Tax=Mesorhizobium sp. TaxID=1871066 RepID=UPI001200CD47|nr:hypothetical protein [Mesorhizobium sp.]TIL33945.1 MAG: hypothetical protein E5Y85_12230 [Mesorhizobium sp.]
MRKPLAVALFVLSLLGSEPSRADTTATLIFVNSGAAIGELRIYDVICDENRYGPKAFAANDATGPIDTFCVKDASKIVTDVKIYKEGAEAFSLIEVPTNSTVDVFNGKVTSP